MKLEIDPRQIWQNRHQICEFSLGCLLLTALALLVLMLGFLVLGLLFHGIKV